MAPYIYMERNGIHVSRNLRTLAFAAGAGRAVVGAHLHLVRQHQVGDGAAHHRGLGSQRHELGGVASGGDHLREGGDVAEGSGQVEVLEGAAPAAAEPAGEPEEPLVVSQ